MTSLPVFQTKRKSICASCHGWGTHCPAGRFGASSPRSTKCNRPAFTPSPAMGGVNSARRFYDFMCLFVNTIDCRRPCCPLMSMCAVGLLLCGQLKLKRPFSTSCLIPSTKALGPLCVARCSCDGVNCQLAK